MDKRTGLSLYEVEVKPDQTVWEPFIERGVLNGIIGGSEVGKSNFLRQLSIAIVQKQKKFLGHSLHVRHGKVIFVSLEDSEVKVARIFQDFKPELQEDKSLINLEFIYDYEGKLHEILAGLFEKDDYDLCIIDCMSDVYEGRSLNDHVEMKKFLKPYVKLAQNKETAILFLHHLNKSADENAFSKKDSTGSAAFEQKIRVLLSLTKGLNDQRNLRILKGNYVPEEFKAREFNLKFMADSLDFEYLGYSNLKGAKEDSSRVRITEDEKIRVAAFLIEQKVGKGGDNPTFKDAREMVDEQFGFSPSVGALSGYLKKFKKEALEYIAKQNEAFAQQDDDDQDEGEDDDENPLTLSH